MNAQTSPDLTKAVKYTLVSIVILGGFGLTLSAVGSYSGSKHVYLLFSAVFWLMLLTTASKRATFGYIFLAVMMWLGFWLKLTVHLIFDYAYVEPIGQFDGSAVAWDRTLWVSIVSCIGVMIAKGIYAIFFHGDPKRAEADRAKVPRWYAAARKFIWPTFIVGMLALAVANAGLGIQQLGLVPRTILPWPLNALIAWQVSIGSSLMLTVLLWWDMAQRKSSDALVYVLVLEAGASAASLLSRGIYIFHTVPQLFALFLNRRMLNRFSKTRIVIFSLLFGSLLVVSVASVTVLRAYLYPNVGAITSRDQVKLTRLEVLTGGIKHVKKLALHDKSLEGHLQELLVEKRQLENSLGRVNGRMEIKESTGDVQPGSKDLQSHLASANTPRRSDDYPIRKEEAKRATTTLMENKGAIADEFLYVIGSSAMQKIVSLSVDRWIGLEGVMAVAAYSDKNTSLLVDAFTEGREANRVTKFQTIANSHYQWTDSSNWQFASLPGATAFLFFSGSLWIVLFGMTISVGILQLSEQLVFKLTANPLLCSLFGFTVANTISQFGVAPRQDIKFYIMILGFTLLVYVLQSKKINDFFFRSQLHLKSGDDA